MSQEQEIKAIDSYVRKLRSIAMVQFSLRMLVYLVAGVITATVLYVWSEKLTVYSSCKAFHVHGGLPKDLAGVQCQQFISTIPW